MKALTKSNYLVGLECPRYLWIVFNQPEQIRKATLAEEFKFKEGDKAGQIAKMLFPEGIDLPTDYKENLKESKESLKKKKPLFEAGFEFNNCFSRADILVPVGDKWDIIEVKSSTKVKDINVHDVSFQKYVYEGNGLKIRKCFLLHLNKGFVKSGEIDVNNLFEKEDITGEVEKAIKGIDNQIKELFDFVSLKEPPKAGLSLVKVFKDGFHDCFSEGCVELPENHVFCLYRGGKLSCELFENGIETIKEIPEDIKLNGKQKIQRDCEINGKIFVDEKRINNFMKKLQYPLYYLDFETFSTSVPLFDGLKPYSQVCFQFSLHVVEEEGAEPKHYEFLYNGNKDPREDFVLALKKVLGDKGSIVVYNQSFEIGRLKELAEHFPEHKEWVESVLKRIIDLLIPFREFSYYNPKQEGSASLKAVLPAITGKSYKELDGSIKDGGTASVEFYNMAYEDVYSEDEREKIRGDLLKYCELDTLAEMLIVNKLKEIVS
ncbi:MAG: DUF2779 domain-containing protein [Candidatus Pacearchaeota archaeon]